MHYLDPVGRSGLRLFFDLIFSKYGEKRYVIKSNYNNLYFSTQTHPTIETINRCLHRCLQIFGVCMTIIILGSIVVVFIYEDNINKKKFGIRNNQNKQNSNEEMSMTSTTTATTKPSTTTTTTTTTRTGIGLKTLRGR
jgi:hypothetical protein